MDSPELIKRKIVAEKHVRSLILGTHPASGQKLPVGILDHPEVLRSLLLAEDALKRDRYKVTHSIRGAGNKHSEALRVGQGWTETEDQELRDAVMKGCGLRYLCMVPGRTANGVLSRIVHLELSSSVSGARDLLIPGA